MEWYHFYKVFQFDRVMHLLNMKTLKKQRELSMKWTGMSCLLRLYMLIGHSAKDLLEGEMLGGGIFLVISQLMKFCA